MTFETLDNMKSKLNSEKNIKDRKEKVPKLKKTFDKNSNKSIETEKDMRDHIELIISLHAV